MLFRSRVSLHRLLFRQYLAKSRCSWKRKNRPSIALPICILSGMFCITLKKVCNSLTRLLAGFQNMSNIHAFERHRSRSASTQDDVELSTNQSRWIEISYRCSARVQYIRRVSLSADRLGMMCVSRVSYRRAGRRVSAILTPVSRHLVFTGPFPLFSRRFCITWTR
jgi:hypothetical protein